MRNKIDIIAVGSAIKFPVNQFVRDIIAINWFNVSETSAVSFCPASPF